MISHRPPRVMPTGTTSYFAGSSAASTLPGRDHRDAVLAAAPAVDDRDPDASRSHGATLPEPAQPRTLGLHRARHQQLEHLRPASCRRKQTASTACGDRHVDVVVLGELEHRAARLDALGDLAVGRGLGLLERLAAAEPLAEACGCATAASCRWRRGRRARPARRRSAGRRRGSAPSRAVSASPRVMIEASGVVAEAHALRRCRRPARSRSSPRRRARSRRRRCSCTAGSTACRTASAPRRPAPRRRRRSTVAVGCSCAISQREVRAADHGDAVGRRRRRPRRCTSLIRLVVPSSTPFIRLTSVASRRQASTSTRAGSRAATATGSRTPRGRRRAAPRRGRAVARSAGGSSMPGR